MGARSKIPMASRAGQQDEGAELWAEAPTPGSTGDRGRRHLGIDKGWLGLTGGWPGTLGPRSLLIGSNSLPS